MIAALLAAPATTDALATDSYIHYATKPTTGLVPNGMTVVSGDINYRGESNAKSGTSYTSADDFITVYIDDHASVVVGADLLIAQFVAIGEPYETATLPSGQFRYSGIAMYNAELSTGGGNRGGGGFKMRVDFAERKVTDFQAVMNNNNGQLTTDAVTAAGLAAVNDIRIDPNTGAFRGGLNFVRGTDATPAIENPSAGVVYGQFHGNAASGVTGAYHNTGNSVYGVFGGSKE